MQTTLSRAQARERLARLPAILAGRDPHPAGERVRQRIGAVVLELIRAAFLVKALGGTDEAGLSWPESVPAHKNHRPTLIRSGDLVTSLEPGQAGNILRTAMGVISVGSELPYAGRQHKERPFWREPLPETWLRRIEEELAQGAREIAQELLQGG